MAKPIEWTTERATTTVPQRRHLEVCVCEERDQPRPGGWQKVDQQWATPADIAAALGAMSAEEREEVAALTVADGRPALFTWTEFNHAVLTRVERAERAHGELYEQIDTLAKVIRANVPGEPSRLEGTVDCAIRVIKELAKAELEHADFVIRATAIAQERDALRVKLDSLRTTVAEAPSRVGYSYTDAVILFQRDPTAAWTCDELQQNHDPEACCRFCEGLDASVSFKGADSFIRYRPTQNEATSTSWRRVEKKP